MNQNKLKLWAADNLAGCDGGNIQRARIWLCGIEWGWPKNADSEPNKREYYTKGILREIEQANPPAAKDYDFVEYNRYPFNRQFAKLYSVIQGHEIENYLQDLPTFSRDDVFKLNLYPIGFRSVADSLWEQYQLARTFPQFPDKKSYRDWCTQHRFPHLKRLADRHRPDIIICTGLDYAEHFFAAFGEGYGGSFRESETRLIDPSGKNSRPRKFFHAELSNGTHLFVIPFLVSRYGLNSHNLIRQMGEIIRFQRSNKRSTKAA